jgi:hypothetical protein
VIPVLKNNDAALNARARRAAKRAGLKAIRSRRAPSLNDDGQFMLVDDRNVTVAGSRYDLSADAVIKICAEQI